MQLVSGVVWLLRDGEVYVSQSQTAECSDVQTTGKCRKVPAWVWMGLVEGGGGSGNSVVPLQFIPHLRGPHLFCGTCGTGNCVTCKVRLHPPVPGC